MGIKFFSLLISFFVLFAFFINPVFAQATEEQINNFDVAIIAHKDGSMRVEERIEYNFGEEEKHGIFRKIPLVSKVGEDLYRVIEVDFEEIKRDGEEEEYEFDNGFKEIEVKIVDPDETITGVHNYLIIYTVKNGIGSNYSDHDEIYWNATGNNWEVPIKHSSTTITTDFGV